MNLLFPIMDLVTMGNNDSIITVMIVDNDLVIISNNDVITYVIMSSNHVITDIIMSNNPCLRPSLPQAFDSLSSLQVRHSLYPAGQRGLLPTLSAQANCDCPSLSLMLDSLTFCTHSALAAQRGRLPSAHSVGSGQL